MAIRDAVASPQSPHLPALLLVEAAPDAVLLVGGSGPPPGWWFGAPAAAAGPSPHPDAVSKRSAEPGSASRRPRAHGRSRVSHSRKGPPRSSGTATRPGIGEWAPGDAEERIALPSCRIGSDLAPRPMHEGCSSPGRPQELTLSGRRRRERAAYSCRTLRRRPDVTGGAAYEDHGRRHASTPAEQTHYRRTGVARFLAQQRLNAMWEGSPPDDTLRACRAGLQLPIRAEQHATHSCAAVRHNAIPLPRPRAPDCSRPAASWAHSRASRVVDV